MNVVTLLDDFLHALPRCGAASSDEANASASASAASLEDRHDLVLRASADLFRDSPALLENALSLLEQQERHQTGGGEHGDGGGEQRHPAIRRIRARGSGREAVLVRSGGQRRKGRPGGDGGGDEEDERGYYLCLLGDARSDGRSLLADGASRVRRPLHCTCRSYLQNTMAGGGGRGALPSATDAAPDPCKHLLASILMPHLLPWSRRPAWAEVVDDKEFARLMLAASIG